MARRPSADRRRPSALGTVETLPSGRFRASYRIEGHKFSAPRTFETKTAAEGWLATERADRLRGTWRDPRGGQVTVAEYLQAWLDSSRNLSPRTVELYRSTVERWITRPTGACDLGPLTLAQLSPAVVRRWFAAVSDAARDAALRRAERSAARQVHPARVWALAQGLTTARTGRLSPELVEQWRDAGQPMPAARAATTAEPGRTTAAQAYRTLHTALEAAVRDGLLTSNPCTIPGAGAVRHRERGTANPAEVVALAHAMPERLRAAVIVAAWSGLRYGELFALARRHIDTDARRVRVERALPGRTTGADWGLTKTRGSVRSVTLPGFVMAELIAHMERFTGPGPDALVFATSGDRPHHSANVSAAFRRARMAIGRDDLTWHDLRHTGATLAYQAGGTVKDVQRRLGHTTARAAMIYAHAADDSDRLLAERLDVLYAGDDNVRPLLRPDRVADSAAKGQTA